MLRRRLGVVLLVPSPAATEIQGLRRACGDRRLGLVAPHVTLVPPVNVREDDLPAALAVVREAAIATASAAPIVLSLGPPATFFPDTPTLHLPMTSAAELAALGRLRERVFRGPLERPVDWPFVPHVTLCDEMDPRRIAAAVGALVDYEVTVAVDRIHVLEERGDGSGNRRWEPVADAPFGPRHVVGRGGVELELTFSEGSDPEVVALEATVAAGSGDALTPPEPLPEPPPGAVGRVVAARRRGTLVGFARGWVRDREGDHDLQAVVVAPAQRRQGIGRQLERGFVAGP